MGMTDVQNELEQMLRMHHVTEEDVRVILALTEGYSEQLDLTDFLKKNPEATTAEIIQKATDCKLAEQLMLCLEEYPPDLAGARALLDKGADIHHVNSFGEPLLAEIIMGYPLDKAMNPCTICNEHDACEVRNCEKTKKAYDSEYLPAVVRFFLENGYDVTRDGGKFGAEALEALCWSSSDKLILEAAKLLLDAGADPLVIMEDREDVFAAIDWVSAGCIPVDEDLELECLYAAYYDIAEGKTKGLDYNKIQWWDAAAGKEIKRVLSCAPSGENAVFTVSTGVHQYENCFANDMILDCDGTMLAVSQYCHAYVDPCKIPENPIDLSDKLENIIGKKIVDVQFSLRLATKGRTRAHGSMLRIVLDDGSSLVIQDNGDQFDEEYCARFEID